MSRSFRPSDFRWRDTPWIVCGLVGLSLVIGGIRALVARDPAWTWLLGVGVPFLGVYVLWSVRTAASALRQEGSDDQTSV